ncbi:MAG TPA: Clp1/GlmU family protein [Deltaproteobacteria bacterium]|nr:Clp1/GlmU family protein [Deltaproteobacteria bacterium]
MIVPEESWHDLLGEIEQRKDTTIVYVLGASDRGKTTFCRFILERIRGDLPAAYIDCDPGQSSIGPPATIGLCLYQEDSVSTFLCFIGSISPKRHLLQSLSGTRKLVEKALAYNARTIIIDSSGYVLDTVAKEFQFQIIDLIRPDYLVAFQREDELEDILLSFAGHTDIKTVRMSVPQAVAIRTTQKRKEYRQERFRSYFKDARLEEVCYSKTGLHGMIGDLRDPAYIGGLLMAMCDQENFVICLGIVRECDPQTKTMYVFAPPFEHKEVRSIQLGSVHLDVLSLRDDHGDGA